MSRSKIGVVFDSSAYAPKPLEHTGVVELRVNKVTEVTKNSRKLIG